MLRIVYSFSRLGIFKKKNLVFMARILNIHYCLMGLEELNVRHYSAMLKYAVIGILS